MDVHHESKSRRRKRLVDPVGVCTSPGQSIYKKYKSSRSKTKKSDRFPEGKAEFKWHPVADHPKKDKGPEIGSMMGALRKSAVMDVQFQPSRSTVLVQWLCSLHNLGFDGVIGRLGRRGASATKPIGRGVPKGAFNT
jgi:hypothetical protein